MAAGLVIHGLPGFGACADDAELFRRQGLKDLCQLLFQQTIKPIFQAKVSSAAALSHVLALVAAMPVRHG
jgi:hypothetical protein